MSHVKRVIFVTGTDTGVGKTVLTALLTRTLRARLNCVAALKPLCSGGRDDAEVLHELQKDTLSLEEINPWHFRAAVSPLIAARQSGRTVRLKQVIDHVRTLQEKFPLVIVEGAGGLLSPMGEDFDSRDLIRALRAIPVIVCTNKLGAVNQVRLVLEALPKRHAMYCPVVFMTPAVTDDSARTNLQLLQQFVSGERIYSLPRIDWRRGKLSSRVNKTVESICRNLSAGLEL